MQKPAVLATMMFTRQISVLETPIERRSANSPR